MREIKFRAWDRRLRKFHYWDFEEQRYNNAFWEIVKNEKMPLMQFTGKKDKDVVEIYEGDIIETTVDNLTRRTVVIFENAKFYGKKKGCSCGDSLMITNKKVVGNIFDNPELLED